MLVVVPLNLLEDWYAKYESLTDMVVPRETSMIFQDSDHAVMTVSLFHQVVDEFKHKARENKFVVRDFVFDPVESQTAKNELTQLRIEKKKEFGTLVRWLKTNFSESFIAWIHIKALRIHVDSVLR